MLSATLHGLRVVFEKDWDGAGREVWGVVSVECEDVDELWGWIQGLPGCLEQEWVAEAADAPAREHADYMADRER